ncbi:hypothetical protein [Streptomyces coeruleorubidus]|uniref:hypothetical protein n=1 Tax=Streptomyces coeruleorubidus TaxID=116188 RepID=UPI0036B31FE7
MTTGIHTGDVRVTVESHSQRPDPDPGWEEIAEISCNSSSGELLVTSFMDDPADLPSACIQVVGRRPVRVRDLEEVVLRVHQGCACTGGLIHSGLVWSHLARST